MLTSLSSMRSIFMLYQYNLLTLPAMIQRSRRPREIRERRLRLCLMVQARANCVLLLEPAGYGVFVFSEPLAGSVERIHVLVDDVEHHGAHVFTAPVEVVQEVQDVFRTVLGEVVRQDGVDALGLTENAFGVLEVLQVVSSPHPVGTPAGNEDPLITVVGAVQGSSHGSV